MADETHTEDRAAERLREQEAPDESSVLSEELHAQRLADRLDLEYVDLENFQIDPELFRSIPVDLMFRYNFVPRHKSDTGLVVVVSDPTDVLTIDELELLLGTSIELCVGTQTAIQEILKKSESSQRVLEEATEDFRIQIVTENEETGEETLSIDRMTSDSSPIIKLVDSTIFNALQRRTSDIHIETRDRAVVIKYRIDGVLYQAMEPIDKKFHSTIISRIKIMSELDISEKRVPQDGRFKLRIKGRTIDFRVSIMPSVHGEDAVIRVLDKESMSQEFSQLSLEVCGFEERDKRRLRRFIREPYGMVLVTGPTGSGKTTTLYAALSEIRNEEDKIVTIEDPVEYQLPGITQIPVNEKKGLTFARGLRSILRHDPDKVMVGEIRDPETAGIAIQSALTGHLVFTTVHANNVVDVVGRFLNMKVEPYNFVSALNCILAQRLVRLICESCKRPTRADSAQLIASALDPKRYGDYVFHEGKGCIDCNGTGYKGRTAIAELLNMSDRIREMILQRKPGADIKRAAKEEGMTFLREAALAKAFAGKTTLHEINKVTFVD
jgi:type II secretory ATPase GspE/PulE/Tfp pilus assembly ATPase PilB-like protein